MPYWLSVLKTNRVLKRILGALKGFVFPQNCCSCGLNGQLICDDCLAGLKTAKTRCLKCANKNPFGIYCVGCKKPHQPDKALACFAFNGVLRELIHQFKYEDASSLSEIFGDRIAQKIKTIPNFKDFSLAFIPLAKHRLHYRGYNQSRLLCEVVSRRLGLPITDMLTRVDTAKSQVQSDNSQERKKNIKGAFMIKNNLEIPKNIILIDDVITTGATVEEATKVLKAYGAQRVYIAALAMV